jgi:hypothetical protein
MSSESNRRIAKNTGMLYFRMLITMAVSLYTSRIVLNTLGVTDYGIYNVVEDLSQCWVSEQLNGFSNTTFFCLLNWGGGLYR